METYTGHWTEGPFQGLGALVPWTFMEVSWFDFAIVLVLLNMRGMMRHDERFVWLIGNHHLLHHKFPRYNYGEYLYRRPSVVDKTNCFIHPSGV